MSPIIIVPLVPPPVVEPKAVLLIVPNTVPAFIVNPPVKVFIPDKVNCDVALFWMTPVTLVPMTALMVVVPVPVPELVMVPVWLIEVVERVIVPVLVLFIIMFPVPVMPPFRINAAVPLDKVKLLFKDGTEVKI